MRYAILLITIIFFTLGSTTSASSNDELRSSLDALLQDTSVRPFNGVVLVAQGNKVLYLRTQGYSDFDTKTPIKVSDKFRIQSNSKQITAVLTLREVERGTIDLDAMISTYLPSMDQGWADRVTVHNLLNMTSGITDLDDDLAFEPGTDFHYSNPGYGLLGAILEAVTDRPYVDLAESLFKELGMDDTSPYIMGGENDVIQGHVGTPDDIRPLDFNSIGFTQDSWKRFIPTGGLISTPQDLLTWDMKLHNGRLLTASSYEKMVNYSITASHAAFGPHLIGYGYGVRIDDTQGKTHIGHGGRGIGFANIKVHFPEDDISLIVLENVYLTDPSANGADMIYHFEKSIKDTVLDVLAR